MLIFIVAVALAVARLRHLFAVVMLFAIFSLLSAAVFVSLDAVDVAFTEAAVGAGISTILMLATLAVTRSREEQAHRVQPLAWAAAVFTGAVLLYGTVDYPKVGDPLAPAHQHVAPRYIQESGEEIGIPNVVTSVLASYRGYDTLGEVTVIFTAGIGVLCLLGPTIRLFRKHDED
ncbi:MAG TPA: DUF4040 domain-containing protein [Gammaproteobacteria bacterium]|nr:DUF4040 domain-containing protein [Gammaproteobacteria bacterium]